MNVLELLAHSLKSPILSVYLFCLMQKKKKKKKFQTILKESKKKVTF